MSRLTFGTPPSPEVKMPPLGPFGHGSTVKTMTGHASHGIQWPASPAAPAPSPSPIVAIRPSGPHSSELLIVQDGRQTIVPLTWGHLSSLAADAVAAMIRYEEKRK